MFVTVYTGENCQQCRLTGRWLAGARIPHKMIPITPTKAEEFKLKGHQTLPVVITPEGEMWSGFRPDRLKELARKAQK